MSQVFNRRAAGAVFAITPIRPVYLANNANASTSGSFTVTLPPGWSLGDLAVMCINSNAAGAITISGWTTLSVVSSGSVYSHILYRVLQAGDSDPVVPGTSSRSAVLWTFQTGTFNTTTPVVHVASNSGSSATASVPTGSTVNGTLHYQMQLVYGYGQVLTPATYPLANAQRIRAVGTAPSIVSAGGCGDPFDGGTPPAGSISMANSVTWVSRKIVIVGANQTP